MSVTIHIINDENNEGVVTITGVIRDKDGRVVNTVTTYVYPGEEHNESVWAQKSVVIEEQPLE